MIVGKARIVGYSSRTNSRETGQSASARKGNGMIKVFENFELSIVGQVQSLLEAHGIQTFLKNQYASGALGELPFVEICPQLFILDQADLPEANRLIRELDTDIKTAPPVAWRCDHCGSDVDGELGACWNCSEPLKAKP